jgi:formamidopyrimidine-DNA glycosylase
LHQHQAPDQGPGRRIAWYELPLKPPQPKHRQQEHDRQPGAGSAGLPRLLDQRLVAGVGNIYASEALHRAGLSPLRRSSTIATAAGRPRPHAVRLVSAIKATLTGAIAGQARRSHSGRFLVYEREGEPCRRRGCGGTVRRITQAGRSTFYCPRCQR